MTGYPADLLDPDLDLEADLGVDTVKQAEVFAAVRGAWDLERDENLKLRDFPTMNHVAGWVRERPVARPPAQQRPLPRPRLQPGRGPSARPDHLGRSARDRCPPRRILVLSRARPLTTAATPASCPTAPASSSAVMAGCGGRTRQAPRKAGATVLFLDPRKSAITSSLAALPSGRRKARSQAFTGCRHSTTKDVTAYGLGEWQGALQRRVIRASTPRCAPVASPSS